MDPPRARSNTNERIQAVLRNPSLSPTERQAMVQRILSGQDDTSPPLPPPDENILMNGSEGSTPVTPPSLSYECPHYVKKCSHFYFSCCQRYDHCHRCHSEHADCTIKPPEIATIKCDECDCVQEVARACRQCGVEFSRNFCASCKLWSSHEHIYHCDKCGLCRVGKEEDHFHCDHCNSCFMASSEQTHVCSLTPLSSSRCPFCFESVHSSQLTTCILACRHTAHSSCMHRAVKLGEYRCPTCRKSMFDMSNTWDALRYSISMQPMPQELLQSSGELRTVYCNDCEKKNETPYHFLGLECKECGSFNTVIDD